MRMLLEIMSHIDGKNLFLVIVPDFQMDIITIHTAPVYQSVLFLITQQRFIVQNQTKSVRRGTIKS